MNLKKNCRSLIEIMSFLFIILHVAFIVKFILHYLPVSIVSLIKDHNFLYFLHTFHNAFTLKKIVQGITIRLKEKCLGEMFGE